MTDVTEVCPYCERPLDNPAAEAAVKFGRDVDAGKLPTWYTISQMADGETKQLTGGWGLLHKIATAEYDDERNHGGDMDAFIIFEVGGHLFRKNGVSDSYGETSWNGMLKPVIRKTQTVTVYE